MNGVLHMLCLMRLVFFHFCCLNLGCMEALYLVSRPTDEVGGKAGWGGWESRSLWGAFIRSSAFPIFLHLPTISETESGLFPFIMVEPSLMFPSFCSIFSLFYPFHNAGRLDGAQGSLAPSDDEQTEPRRQ